LKFILKRLPFWINGKASFDYVLIALRGLLTFFFVASSGLALFSLITLIFGYTISDTSYKALFFILLAFTSVQLYLGIWHTRITSRQVYEPLKRLNKVKEVKRVELIKKGLLTSFGGAIIAQLDLIVLTISNYVLKSLSTTYHSASLFSTHNETFLGYNNQESLLASPIPFLTPELYNAVLVITPIFILVFLYVNSYIFDIRKYHKLVEQWIKRRFYRDACIEHLVFDTEAKGVFSLTIGIHSETQSPVIMDPSTLALNTAFFGLIGTGKSSSLAKPFVISVSKNFAIYLREFGGYVKRVKRKVKRLSLSDEAKKIREKEMIEEWFSKGLGKNLVSGFYLNEPSGDLVGDSRYILEKVGIPKKAIWDIDPLNTYTDAINIFDADIEMASSLAADLFRDFSEGNNSSGNSFFLNSEEAHTKSLVTLLIASSKVPDLDINKHLNGGAPTFSEFYQLLTDNNFIFSRVNILRVIYQKELRDYNNWKADYDIKYEKAFDEWVNSGRDKELFRGNQPLELWDEGRELEDKFSEISNLKSAIDYFINSYYIDPRTDKPTFSFDANIQGLVATIRRLAMDKRVRRVFFSQSTKNIDVLLKYGGVLLVNSASAELGRNNSKMVAQVAEIIMQSSAFRRPPNKYPLFPYIQDEKNTFLMVRDSDFLNQNRKFRTPVIHFYQNYEQAVATVGVETANALFQSYRNAFMFQQQSPETIKFLSDRAGKKWALSSSFRGAEGRFLASNDDNKEQLTETIEEVDQITQAGVSKLEEMEFLGIMVVENEVSEPMKVTSTPSFKMPIFTDENYQPDFDISNKKDKEVFDIWQNYVDEFYIENIKKTSYYEDDFTPEEWQTLLKVINPINLSLSSFDSEDEEENAFAVGEERNNRTKENIGKRDDRKGTTTDLNKASKSETLDGEEVQISEHKEDPKEVKEVAPEVKKEQPKEEVNPVDIIQEIAKTIRPEKQGTVAQNVQSYTELTEVIDEKEDMF
jgi:hypothetical protein